MFMRLWLFLHDKRSSEIVSLVADRELPGHDRGEFKDGDLPLLDIGSGRQVKRGDGHFVLPP